MTAILQHADPLWWWLRENFRVPSLVAIAGVVASAGLWIWSQHTALEAVSRQLGALARADQVEQLAGSVRVLKAQLDDQGDRLDRVEQQWDRVTRVADEPIPPRRRRRP